MRPQSARARLSQATVETRAADLRALWATVNPHSAILWGGWIARCAALASFVRRVL